MTKKTKKTSTKAKATKPKKKSKEKDLGGRPLFDGKSEESVIQKLEQAFAIDATIKEACSYADISVTAYYEWLKKNPKFRERFDRLREQPVLAARRTVVNNVQHNPEMAMKYLERKRKAEFSTRQIITGETFTTEMSEEHAKEATKALRYFGEDDELDEDEK